MQRECKGSLKQLDSKRPCQRLPACAGSKLPTGAHLQRVVLKAQSHIICIQIDLHGIQGPLLAPACLRLGGRQRLARQRRLVCCRCCLAPLELLQPLQVLLHHL